MSDKEVLESSKEERRESKSGVHFIELYNACQRKFFFTYHLGLRPVFVDKALIFGGAFHEAKAHYYDTQGDLTEAVKLGKQEIEDRRKDFFSPEDFEFSYGRLDPLLTAWHQKFGIQDFQLFDVVATEEEFRITVPFTPSYVLTQRHDTLLKRKTTGKIFTMETKTASSSLPFTMDTTRDSSQVTGYNWGGQQVFGNQYGGLIIDVAYWSSRSKNPKTIQCERSEPINKGQWDTKKFVADAASLFNEIEAKQRSLASGVPAEFLYRRNCFYCHSFFRPCPMLSICNMPTKEAIKRLPEHLHVDKSSIRLDGMTYDTIHYGE